MSIFGSIMSKIFHHGGTAAAAPATASASAAASASAPPAAAPAAPVTTAAAGAAPATPAQPVDVEAVCTALAAKAGQKLDWRHSIVDLMKLLDLDSSLTARKDLAKELGYTGDTGDSATMNVWLHKQVMKKLAENGGKVPDDLKA
jgi:3-oxoacyl-ACP reductase-like protein